MTAATVNAAHAGPEVKDSKTLALERCKYPLQTFKRFYLVCKSTGQDSLCARRAWCVLPITACLLMHFAGVQGS